MAKYLAGIDVGTTGTRCVVFDLQGKIIANGYREYGAIYPKPGWVDQNLEEMLPLTMDACKEAIQNSGINPAEIAAVGFSTQRSVTVPVDEAGNTIRPMLSWQDARTGDEVADIAKVISPEKFYEISGMPLGTTWNVTKMLWMRKNEPELFKRTYKFVQLQDVVLKAFGAEDFYTDLPDLAFYGVWDVTKLDWGMEILEPLELSPEMFGKPTNPGTKVASVSKKVAEQTGFAFGTPICVGAGDQNCGVVGMGSTKSGMATVSLGTGGLVCLSIDKRLPGFGGLMITNHAVPGMWDMEGLSNAAASSYRWFRDVVGTMEISQEKATGRNAYEYLNDLVAQAIPGSKGLLYLPYLGTAATPRWNDKARAAFIGMSFAHGRAEMARSVMEGVTLEIRDMLDGWLKAGVQLTTMRLGGGATKSRIWNQIQADVYGRPVETLKTSEATVLGAAILGGVGSGVFENIQEGVDAMVQIADHIEPNMENHAVYEDMYSAYVSAYEGLTKQGAFEKIANIQSR